MAALISKDPFQLTGRYAERSRWENLGGPGDSRPTGDDVLRDEGLLVGGDALRDKVILITGTSSGMGPATVRALAQTGATIYATARDLDKARAALGRDLLDTGRVHLLRVDQADMASVRACAAEFRRRSGGRLNVMINNAAVMRTPETRTADGFELQFATNHLSHFLLFYLLRDLLLASATPGCQSRVVNVSSLGHRYSPICFDNLMFEGGSYEGWLVYGQSKTANIYMANQIERLYGAQGLHGYSVNPGSFVSPNLQKHASAEMEAAIQEERFGKYYSSVEQACAGSVYGAVAKELEGKGGLYIEGASVAVREIPPDGDVLEYGYAAWAFDAEKEERLWAVSKKLVGVE